jgi:predicted nucleotidyltransferase
MIYNQSCRAEHNAMNLIETLQALSRENVDFVLVGGLAVSLHGVVRGTMDVDIVLAMNDSNLDRFIETARKLGLRPLLPVAIDSLKNADLLEQWHREKNMLAFSLRPERPEDAVIDVLIRPVASYTEMAAQAVHMDVGGVQIPVASIEHLIEMKSSADRDIDRFDVDALRRLGGGRNA